MATTSRRRVTTSNSEATIVTAVELPTDTVTVTVPRAFTLTLDSGSPVSYQAGVQEMPADHADHWFSRAQGVTVYIPAAPATPVDNPLG